MFQSSLRFAFKSDCFRALIAILVFLAAVHYASATSRDIAFEVVATTSSVSPYITISWPGKSVTGLTIYRRVKGASTWGAISWSGGSNFVDTTALPGVTYEYSFRTSNNYFGGIAAGYNIPLVESRGRVILLVDNTMATALAPEIAQLQKNLVADGWTVYRHDVPRETVSPASYSSSVWAARIAEQQNIRSIIQADYNTAPDNNWALFILGRIPVPYSGVMAPDGHGGHLGAWPTDDYYADVDGVWTDSTNSSSTTGLADARNVNLVGDGKFDTSTLPSDLELQCGRVDLSNMTMAPVGVSETELLRQYLVRDDNFRRAQEPYANIARRGIVDDNFGSYADMAWCTGAAFFGNSAGQMDALDWFTTLSTTPMLFAYGSGPGDWTSAAGIGDTSDFNKTDSKAVFTMLFGSFFGDWDCPNCFMRAPLAGTSNSLGLTCTWSGLGETPLYHMALGDPIGYCTRRAFNSAAVVSSGDWYQLGNYRYTHQALLGDPTLRLHSIVPPTKVTATSTTSGVTISWLPSSDSAVAGYHIYRATSFSGPFTRISGTTATGANPTGSCLSASTRTYTDTDSSLVANTTYTYLVKTVKMETSASGIYANQSLGESVTLTHLATNPVPAAPTRLVVYRTGTSICVLTWDDNATNETGYLVERRDPSTGVWSQIASLKPNITSRTDVTATPGKVVYYRVRAVAGTVYSDYSNIAADYGGAGLVYANGYSYTTTKSAGTFSTSVTRFNGGTGSVSVDYTVSALSGTPGIDFTATTSTVTWGFGETGTKSPLITIGNPSGVQPTKILKVTYSNPTNGLVLNTPTSSNVFIADPAAQALPSPWLTATVGNVISTDSGYAEYVNGSFGLATRNSGMFVYGTDSFRYLYQTVTGNFQFTARLAQLPATGNTVRAGLMVRSDQTNNSVMSGVVVSSDNSCANYLRTTAAGTTSNPYMGSVGSVPCWLRITRTNSSVTVQYSADGVNWTGTSTTALANLNSSASVGMIVSSEPSASTAGSLGYAQFDNVSLVTTAYPAVGAIASFTAATGTNAGEIVLNWSAATNAVTYQIERSTLSNSGFLTIATVNAPIITYTDGGLAANTNYYYRVKAFNPGNGSAYTPVALAQAYLPAGIAGWRYIYFGMAEINDGLSGDLDLASGMEDRITNLMIYALGAGDPNVTFKSSSILPVVKKQTIGSASYLTCSFTHNTAATDVQIALETASSMNGPWSSINPLVAANQYSVASNTPTAGIETIVIKDSQPVTASSQRFMRLKVTHGSNVTTTTPQGYVTLNVLPGTGTAYTLTAISLPLNRSYQGAECLADYRSNLGTNTVSNTLAEWTAGVYANATTPYAMRITTGSASGRLYVITANSASTLTLDTQGDNLTTLNFLSYQDSFEVVPLDTIASFFGTPSTTGVLGVATAAQAGQADQVMILTSAGVWNKYYFNTTSGDWRQVGLNTASNNVILRPNAAILYNRIGATPLSFMQVGRVPDVQRSFNVANSGLTFVSNGWPTALTLGTSGIRQLAGWVTNTNPNNADIVQVIVSGAWRKYYHDGTQWRQVGLMTPSNTVTLPIGGGVMINKVGSATGSTLFTQSLPYNLP